MIRCLPLLMFCLAGCAGGGASSTPPVGGDLAVLAADPSTAGVTLWARAPGKGPVTFALAGDGARRATTVRPAVGADGTVRARFSDLRPETGYRYRVEQGAASATGAFRTPAGASTRAAVRFVWGGDVAGQDVCRDVVEGLPAVAQMARTAPDFTIGLGDMIYADDPCTAQGRYGNDQLPDIAAPATTRAAMQAKWRYTREDPALRGLLAGAGYYAVWDDHEVVNDFGPASAGDRYAPGRSAFADYNPVHGAGEGFYRAARWGRHLDLVILDTRTFRDPNAAPDGPGNTLLGAAQRHWLIDRVRESHATWKVVVSSVPIALPTGWPPTGPRDGWASGDGPTGYEWELHQVLRAWAEAGVRDVVFLTTDVHHATAFRYRPYPEHPDFVLHEFVTGPIQAGVFPVDALDVTFNPHRLFLHSPARAEDVRTWEEALRWFNFGVVEIDPNGRFDSRVVNALGETVARVVLQPR